MYTVSLIGGKIKKDFYVKDIDIHQYLHTSSCHPLHSQKEISYSQDLHLNTISSDPNSFNWRCNDFEKMVIESGCNEREVREQILRWRGF